MLKGMTPILLATVLFVSCDESNLRSGGSGKNNAKTDDAALALRAPCTPNGEPSTTSNIIPMPPARQHKLVGEFCPKGVGSMSVLFIVDFSQSMEFPPHLQDRFGKGNDPKVNDSCARLEAANAVIKGISSRLAEGDEVDVSVVPFSSDVHSDLLLANVGLNDFSGNLTPEYFCGTAGLTNYASAFTKAKTILNSSQAQYKVVYFITDGKPYIAKLDANGKPVPRTDGSGNQVDGQKAAQEGRAAMAALKSEVSSLNFYSLFLGNKVENPQEAVNYLNDISGHDNVKVATEASKLADEIVKFSLPGLALDVGSVTATLDGQPIKIVRVNQSQSSGNIWEAETAEFKPEGTSRVIQINAKTVNGKAVQMGVTLSSTAN